MPSPTPPDPTAARQPHLSPGSRNVNPAPPSAPAPGCCVGASPPFCCSLNLHTTQNSPIIQSPHLNCLRGMASFQPPNSYRAPNLDLAYSAQSGQYFPQNKEQTSLVHLHPSHAPALGQKCAMWLLWGPQGLIVIYSHGWSQMRKGHLQQGNSDLCGEPRPQNKACLKAQHGHGYSGRVGGGAREARESQGKSLLGAGSLEGQTGPDQEPWVLDKWRGKERKAYFRREFSKGLAETGGIRGHEPGAKTWQGTQWSVAGCPLATLRTRPFTMP